MKMRKILISLAMGMFFSLNAASAVFAAQDAEIVNDKVGNQFGAGYNVQLGGDVLDVCGAGYNVDLKNTTASGTAAVAGYNVVIDSVNVDGSLFSAGCNVDISDSNIANNIIATGNNISIDSTSSAKSVRLAGSSVKFSGTADFANISGDTVRIDGIINGDAEINANEVIFGDNAKIVGNLTVEAEEEPSVSGKVGGEFSFTEIKTQEELEADNKQSGNSNSSSFGSKVAGVVGGRIYWIVAMLIVAAGLLIFGRDHIELSGESVKKNPGKHIGVGFAALVCVPVASLILAVTVIGLPSAAILLALYIITLSLSQTFAGLALGRILLGERLGKPVIASLLGVVIFVILDAVPWVGGLTSLAATLFTLGYIFIKIFDSASTKTVAAGTIVDESTSAEVLAVEVSDVVE